MHDKNCEVKTFYVNKDYKDMICYVKKKLWVGFILKKKIILFHLINMFKLIIYNGDAFNDIVYIF